MNQGIIARHVGEACEPIKAYLKENQPIKSKQEELAVQAQAEAMPPIAVQIISTEVITPVVYTVSAVVVS